MVSNQTSRSSSVSSRHGLNSVLALLAVGLAVLIFLIAGPAGASPASPEGNKKNPETVNKTGLADSGDFIVVYRDEVPLSSRLKVERGKGVEVEDTYRNVFKGFAARLEAGDVSRLRRDESVLIVEPDRTVTTQSNGSQDRPTPSWGIDRIDHRNLPLNNRLATSDNGFGVEAYIIDTGIRLDHSEFNGRINPEGFSAFSGGWDDCEGHGTHVAGTVAGSTYGVASKARLTAVRVLDCEGSGSYSGVIAGIDWMIADHQSGEAAVGNMSLGGPRSESVNLAVHRAVQDGISMAVAAGNDSGDACAGSPASAPAALTVGSTANDDSMSSFSNFGQCVDLYAPGSNIQSASAGSPGAVEALSGTSMASPHVAGVAALLLSRNQAMTPGDVADRMVTSASPGRITGLQGCSMNRLLYIGPDGDLPAPTLPQAPANDNFASRQTLNALGTVNGTSACATSESGEPGHSQPNAHASVWYSWTAPSNGTLVLETTGSSFDTTLAVYTGTSVGSLTQQASNDDSGSGLTSRVSLPVSAGTAYSVAIDGYRGLNGNTRLSGSFTSGGGGTPGDPPGSSRPANDDFADATLINSFDSPVEGNSEGATAEAGEPGHGQQSQAFASIWYRWTAPTSGELTLNARGPRYRLDVALYTGSTLASLTPVAGGYGDLKGRVRRGVTYSIALDDWALERHTRLQGSLRAAPPNDDFADAAPLGSVPGQVSGTNVAATVEPGEPSHSSWSESTDFSIWYRWTPESNGILDLDVQGTRPTVAVYTGSSVSSLTQLDEDDEEVRVPVRAGTVYSIAVATRWGREAGATHLTAGFLAGPANDDFVDARRIAKWSGKIKGSNRAATPESGELSHSEWGGAPLHSVWYHWTAAWDSIVEVETTIRDFWGWAAVYTGQYVDDLAPVAAGDSFLGVRWRAEKGTSYWIAVDAGSDDMGPFTLRLIREFRSWPEIVAGPGDVTKSRTARFRFAGEEGATFECRLDRQKTWRSCKSTTVYRRLKPGERMLQVRQRYGTSTSIPAFHFWLIRR